jgi:hypothetical protein
MTGDDHVIRKDPISGKRMRNAALLFIAAMIGVGGSLAWVIATAKENNDGGNASIFVCFFVLAVFFASVNVFVAYGRLRWFYRCPECGVRSPWVKEAGALIRYHCLQCRVVWDTGWTEVPHGSD